MMKQAIYKMHGDPAEVVELSECKPQTLQPGQSRVRILRAPINPSDIAQITGDYGLQPPLPAAAGMEGLGEIVEVNGDSLPIGTRVLLADPPGAWATEKILSNEVLVPVPDADIDQLAMLSVNPATAYLLLTQYASLSPGDWIIQSAGNSAVGRMVIQLAQARGVRVASVVRRETALQDIQEAGTDAAFLDGTDLAERVATELDKPPVMALDAVAGEAFARLAATLETGGTAVLYGGLSGEYAAVPYSSLIFNDVAIRGFWLVNWLATAPAAEQARVYGELTQLIVEGKMRAPVDRVFAIEDIAEALTCAMQGGRSGKILIAPNGL